LISQPIYCATDLLLRQTAPRRGKYVCGFGGKAAKPTDIFLVPGRSPGRCTSTRCAIWRTTAYEIVLVVIAAQPQSQPKQVFSA
jgi:hypothetical protein